MLSKPAKYCLDSEPKLVLNAATGTALIITVPQHWFKKIVKIVPWKDTCRKRWQQSENLMLFKLIGCLDSRLGCASFAYTFFGTKRNAKRSHFLPSWTKTNKFNFINSLELFSPSKRNAKRSHFPPPRTKTNTNGHSTHST
jgi:hypothetical protein